MRSDAYQRYFSRVEVNVDLGTAPMTVSFFSPPLNTMTVGMLRMPYSVAMPGLSSVFNFKQRTLPAYCLASSSISGAIMRQGPHHGAQKSTNTGTELSNTSSFHVLSLTTPATEIDTSKNTIQHTTPALLRDPHSWPYKLDSSMSTRDSDLFLSTWIRMQLIKKQGIGRPHCSSRARKNTRFADSKPSAKVASMNWGFGTYLSNRDSCDCQFKLQKLYDTHIDGWIFLGLKANLTPTTLLIMKTAINSSTFPRLRHH